MSLNEDISKFCKDLILGDFEDNPSNAAMVIGGLISLIPVVDQIMDVRDVSGMIFRINRKGIKNCGKDDWFGLALAAFGCIPEVGSLFKTIVKPLYKSRKAAKGLIKGSALVESMLNKSQGAAIKFLKKFDWVSNTRLAVQQTMSALDLCDQLLGELSQPRWWVPDSLEALARDMRPGLGRLRTPIKQGMQDGSRALQDFVTELLGEDGYQVAQMVAVAATSSSGAAGKRSTPGAKPAHAAGSSKPSGHTPPPHKSDGKNSPAPSQKEKQEAKPPTKQHAELSGGSVQNAKKQNSSNDRSRRLARGTELWKRATSGFTGLIGEHMAHYHHMKVAEATREHAKRPPPPTDEPHKYGWTSKSKLVDANGKETHPMELWPEHLPLIYLHGVDGIWSRGKGEYNFVESKAYTSVSSLFTNGARSSSSDASTDSPPTDSSGKPKKSSKKKLGPPPDLTERQLALWYMLGQTKTKGLQMSWEWVKASVNVGEMRLHKNFEHRWVYVYFAITVDSKASKGYTVKRGGELNHKAADGFGAHIGATGEVTLCLAQGTDVYAANLHNPHKSDHAYSDKFTFNEIDDVADKYEDIKDSPKTGTASSGKDTSGKATKQLRNKR